jgi:hypothetical protein
MLRQLRSLLGHSSFKEIRVDRKSIESINRKLRGIISSACLTCFAQTKTSSTFETEETETENNPSSLDHWSGGP